MSDAARLIEKFGLAIHGEEPAVVVTVLCAFVQTCCEKWGVSVQDFAAALLADGSAAIEPSEGSQS